MFLQPAAGLTINEDSMIDDWFGAWKLREVLQMGEFQT